MKIKNQFSWIIIFLVATSILTSCNDKSVIEGDQNQSLGFYKIKNYWTNQYLNIQNNTVVCSNVNTDLWEIIAINNTNIANLDSAQVLLKNKGTGLYLAVPTGNSLPTISLSGSADGSNANFLIVRIKSVIFPANYYQIKSSPQDIWSLAVENGLSWYAAQPTWWSAEWTFEP